MYVYVSVCECVREHARLCVKRKTVLALERRAVTWQMVLDFVSGVVPPTMCGRSILSMQTVREQTGRSSPLVRSVAYRDLVTAAPVHYTYYCYYISNKLNTSIEIVQELCESRGGRPGLSVLTSLLVSLDVKNY